MSYLDSDNRVGPKGRVDISIKSRVKNICRLFLNYLFKFNLIYFGFLGIICRHLVDLLMDIRVDGNLETYKC